MRLRHPVLIAAAVLVCGATSSATSAYDFHAVKWPRGVVPYYNAAPDQAWAVSQAVNAWNTSGARVRFVAVPRSSAKLVIEERQEAVVYCAEGRASIGYYPHGAYVMIFPARGVTHACNRYWAARVMAHELGHVLGLQHEDRYCATMNATGSLRGGAECTPQPLWAWRCRLLEHDDIAGVAAAYGGTPRVKPGPALCPLYSTIAPPRSLKATYDKATNGLTLTFARPAAPAIPAFLVPFPWQPRTSYAIAYFALSGLKRSCSVSGDSTDLPHYRWHVQPGRTERVTTAAAITAGCYAVWSVDQLGRPSDRPAVARLTEN